MTRIALLINNKIHVIWGDIGQNESKPSQLQTARHYIGGIIVQQKFRESIQMLHEPSMRLIAAEVVQNFKGRDNFIAWILNNILRADDFIWGDEW